MLLAIVSIVLRGRILGWALLGKSVISTFQLFYKANRQHHPLKQSFRSHPKIKNKYPKFKISEGSADFISLPRKVCRILMVRKS